MNLLQASDWLAAGLLIALLCAVGRNGEDAKKSQDSDKTSPGQTCPHVKLPEQSQSG